MGSSMASAVLHSLWCVPVPGAVVCGVQGDAVVAAVDAANGGCRYRGRWWHLVKICHAA